MYIITTYIMRVCNFKNNRTTLSTTSYPLSIPLRGERNFHIFYYMYDGLEADNRLPEFHLDPNLRKHHRYLTDHSQTSQTHIDKFQQLKLGFKLLGFQDSEVDTVYRILAAILHLGDIEFGEVASEDNTDNKSRVIDAAPLHRGT